MPKRCREVEKIMEHPKYEANIIKYQYPGTLLGIFFGGAVFCKHHCDHPQSSGEMSHCDPVMTYVIYATPAG
jgi:hypothetical protein